MTILEDLKNKPKISRKDIAGLLSSIGSPGEKRDEKIQAVQELERNNRQGHGIEITLHSYPEY